MNISRILRYGLDPQTQAYVRQVFRHPLESGFRLFRMLSRDDVPLQRLMLRNLALGLPDRTAKEYEEELKNLTEFAIDEYPLFPYPYKDNVPTVIESGVDKKLGLPYVVHKGRRFYGPADQSVEETVRSYQYFVDDEGLLGTGRRTQSPHSYVDANFKVEQDDIVVDVGCSDALFAFDNAEQAGRIYLFEAWERWNAALEASFAPFMEKTRIFARLVSDKTNKREIRLADAIHESDSSHYFIKMDIEGGERSVLESSMEFLCTNKVKLSCCVYHRQDDAKVISNFLKGLGFSIGYSKGYMLPLCDNILFPYFRHGVIYARNY